MCNITTGINCVLLDNINDTFGGNLYQNVIYEHTKKIEDLYRPEIQIKQKSKWANASL